MKRGLAETVRSLKATLWTLIVPPTAWAVHFLFSYFWASVHCAKTGAFSKYAAVFWGGTALALLVIIASGVIAWTQSRTPGDPPPHKEGTDIDRLRFTAYSTLLLAGLSFVAVVFTALPVVFIQDCR